MATAPKLGIVAGAGELPGRLIEACRGSGRAFFVVALKHHAEPAVIGDAPHAWVRLGAAGTSIKALHEAAVEEVVLAGPVRRPTLVELRPDATVLKLAAKGAFNLGDDGLLAAVVRTLEDDEGFKVVGADDVLADLLAPPGALGQVAPDDAARDDIDRGVEIVTALGALDVGQAAVVQQGIVLGVEAVEGTDALLARCAGVRRSGGGGVLVKLAKPQQERRADLPTIGPRTIENAQRAGLAGVAVEAGNTLVMQREETIAAADAAGLFLIGIEVSRDA